MRKPSKYSVVAVALLSGLGPVIAEEVLVAGLRPFERPATAPIVTVFEPGDVWRARALHGVGEVQNGVGFLKDQGAWYTPFTQPNMPGRYDIRGLHDTYKKKD